MRRPGIVEHISLDGVIQHSADDDDFPYTDWTAYVDLNSPATVYALRMIPDGNALVPTSSNARAGVPIAKVEDATASDYDADESGTVWPGRRS